MKQFVNRLSATCPCIITQKRPKQVYIVIHVIRRSTVTPGFKSSPYLQLNVGSKLSATDTA